MRKTMHIRPGAWEPDGARLRRQAHLEIPRVGQRTLTFWVPERLGPLLGDEADPFDQFLEAGGLLGGGERAGEVVERGEEVADDGKRLVLAGLVGFAGRPFAEVVEIGVAAQQRLLRGFAIGEGGRELVFERQSLFGRCILFAGLVLLCVGHGEAES